MFQLLQENAIIAANAPDQPSNTAESSRPPPEEQVSLESQAARPIIARTNQVVHKSGVAHTRPSSRPHRKKAVPIAQGARPVVPAVNQEQSPHPHTSPVAPIVNQEQSLHPRTSPVFSDAMLSGPMARVARPVLVTYINPALLTTNSTSMPSCANTMDQGQNQGQNQTHGKYIMSRALQEPHLGKKPNVVDLISSPTRESPPHTYDVHSSFQSAKLMPIRQQHRLWLYLISYDVLKSMRVV
jgi:hypothetical protein